MLLATCLVISACSSAPKASPEAINYCTKVCHTQHMKLFEVKEDNQCECYERPMPRIMERN